MLEPLDDTVGHEVMPKCGFSGATGFADVVGWSKWSGGRGSRGRSKSPRSASRSAAKRLWGRIAGRRGTWL